MSRQKMILIGGGIGLALLVLVPLFDSNFLEPIRLLETSRTAAKRKLDEAEVVERQIAIAEADLNRWRSVSLPGDSRTAQDEYMEWITQLLRMSGFQADDSLVVKPGPIAGGKGSFTPVRVEVEGRATLGAVSRFLYAFQRTNLLHRMVSFDLVSPQRQGNPVLEVKLTAEGLVIPGAAERDQLFPQSTLDEETTAEATSLRVTQVAGFPKKGSFWLRVEDELMAVTEMADGQWSVERGLVGTRPAVHPAGAEIELLPVRDVSARLRKGIDAKAEELLVADPAGMPLLPGFTIQLDEELLRVVEIAENRQSWKVERGVGGTSPEQHKTNASCRLTYDLEDYDQQLLALSPFVKPDPPKVYEPKLIAADQTIKRGEKLEYTVAASDYNKDAGDVTFAVAEGGPEGLQIDAASGRIAWEPSSEAEARAYELTVEAFQQGREEPIASSKMLVTITDPNAAPELKLPDGLQVFQGGQLSFAVQASDADGHEVKYSAEGNVPSGFAINAVTGECTWEVGSAIPGDYEVTVVAEDNGSPSARTSAPVRISVKEDVARFTVLVACLERDSVFEAWLFDRFNNRRLVLRRGDEFVVADLSGELIEVDRDFVLIRVNEQVYRVDLGADLRSMTRIDPQPDDYESDQAASGSAVEGEAAGSDDGPAAVSEPETGGQESATEGN